MKRFICLLLLGIIQPNLHLRSQAVDWPEIKQGGHGQMTIYFRDTRPFIIYDDNGNLSGIEFELMLGFREHLQKKYDVTLDLNWERKETFAEVYNLIRAENTSGIFGLSIFSYTDERSKEVKFSPLYMPDISVLISSENVPIAQEEKEFREIINGLTAIAVEQTIYEQELINLREKHGYDFEMRYVKNTDDILKTIPNEKNLFGYIDLPNYLIALNENESIKRQNLFPVRKRGYGVIYPLGSNWDEPVNDYFSSPECALLVHNLVKKYLGSDVDHLIENISNAQDGQVILLTKEKEIQSQELLQAALQVQREVILRNLFMIGFIFIGILALVIFNRYRLKAIANRMLKEHRKKIEKQRKNIKKKNGQLKRRNHDLQELNHEKNNLIKILSHDLRAPLNNIQGLTKVFQLENEDLTTSQNKVIDHINDEAARLNEMIRKILDVEAIEGKKDNIELEKVDLGELLQEVVNNFSDTAKSKALSLHSKIDNRPFFAEGDKLYLTQVYENLLSNAIKFSERNSTIEVTVFESNGHLRTVFSDQGPGISEEDQQKMFKKFQRLSAKPTAGEHSTGLGLSIVKKFVEDMNGKVWCESQLGQGTDFIVELKKME